MERDDTILVMWLTWFALSIFWKFLWKMKIDIIKFHISPIAWDESDKILNILTQIIHSWWIKNKSRWITSGENCVHVIRNCLVTQWKFAKLIFKDNEDKIAVTLRQFHVWHRLGELQILRKSSKLHFFSVDKFVVFPSQGIEYFSDFHENLIIFFHNQSDYSTSVTWQCWLTIKITLFLSFSSNHHFSSNFQYFSQFHKSCVEFYLFLNICIAESHDCSFCWHLIELNLSYWTTKEIFLLSEIDLNKNWKILR